MFCFGEHESSHPAATSSRTATAPWTSVSSSVNRRKPYERRRQHRWRRKQPKHPAAPIAALHSRWRCQSLAKRGKLWRAVAARGTWVVALGLIWPKAKWDKAWLNPMFHVNVSNLLPSPSIYQCQLQPQKGVDAIFASGLEPANIRSKPVGILLGSCWDESHQATTFVGTNRKNGLMKNDESWLSSLSSTNPIPTPV